MRRLVKQATKKNPEKKPTTTHKEIHTPTHKDTHITLLKARMPHKVVAHPFDLKNTSHVQTIVFSYLRKDTLKNEEPVGFIQRPGQSTCALSCDQNTFCRHEQLTSVNKSRKTSVAKILIRRSLRLHRCRGTVTVPTRRGSEFQIILVEYWSIWLFSK